MNIRIDFDIDDQAPASPRISAFRRCKEMNPRWRQDSHIGSATAVLTRRADHKPGERPMQQRASAVTFH